MDWNAFGKAICVAVMVMLAGLFVISLIGI